MTTPQVAISRLNGVSATEKPSERLARKSIAAPQKPNGPAGNGTCSQCAKTR